MTHVGRRLRWITLSLSICRSASAQLSNPNDALEAVSIRVDGPQGCPSGEDFWQSLQRRAPGIRLTRPGEPGRVFVVRFQRADDGMVTGHIRILDVEGSALEREISGGTCGEVAEALALIAAVGARGPLPDDTDHATRPARERPARPRPSPPVAVVPVAPVNADPQWRVLLRADASVRARIVPVFLYAAGAGFELAREGSSFWQPAVGAVVEATLTATASTEDVVPNTQMTAQLIMVHLFASPLRWRAGPFELGPYGALDIGQLTVQGQGSGLAREGQTRMFWLAAALIAQADVRLGPHWAVGAKIGAEVHPLLYQYEFTPRDVYQVGDIGFVSGLAVSFRFE
jgi:hypothetical protein